MRGAGAPLRGKFVQPEWAVQELDEYAPWLVAMGVLLCFSAFFSSSEATLFYLNRNQRQRLASGNRAQRMAAGLLADPDSLLTAVLFWNLVVNVAYFTIVSIASLQLERDGHRTGAGAFALVSLLVIIVFSEMLPKSMAVLKAESLAALVAVPLAGAVRLLRPVLPLLRLINLLSRRVLWPKFTPEPYLRVGDLERAVELSTTDAALLEQEQTVLQNIVSLSAIRVDELMRPRTRFRSFRPPVSLADLEGELPPSGYLLVTERESDEVTAAIALLDLSSVPSERLERSADPVVYVPWCTTVADALQAMRRDRGQVAAVVNELGETIGILTFDDVLETIFTRASSRSERLLKRASIRQAGPGVWHVTGITSLRRLVRYFKVRRPAAKSVTVAGVIQETLQRLPERGDRCRWGPFQFTVIDVPETGQLLVEVNRVDGSEEDGR